MKYKGLLAQLLALFVVTTCLTIRVSAADNPQQIEGKIQRNVYTAKNNLFSIAIPHREGSYEYAYMKVKEEFHGEQGAYVSFGPAAFNQSIYRVKWTPGSRQKQAEFKLVTRRLFMQPPAAAL